MKPLSRVILLATLGLLVAGCKKTGVATEPIEQRKPGDVRFLAFGDWGVLSPDRQTVADAMARYVDSHPTDACLLLGDNFKVRLKDTEDPLIARIFENTYDPKRMNFPFFAALGNHDYETKKDLIELAYPKVHPQSRWQMPARYYRLDFPSRESPMVTVFMLDSNKQAMPQGAWTAQMLWLEEELAEPRGQWTLCCAHHTMFSNGGHGDNGTLQRDWGKLFKDYHVDFYVCGHDHNIQHLEIDGWPISFVVSGGGGAPRYKMIRDDRGPFARSTSGFAYLSFTQDQASVRLFDGHGAKLHAFSRDKSGAVNVLFTTPSDKATTHKLRVIQGIDDREFGSATQPAATQPTATQPTATQP